jgi:two-component system sensor histidine kinase DegS
LDELQVLIQRTLENVRRISIALRPPVLEDFGLAIALEALCNDLVQEKPDLSCDFTVSGDARRLDSDLELAIYRVVQEALTNIRKHVQYVKHIQVEITFKDHIVITSVSNDGGGFAHQDSQSYVQKGHLGLAGMYERARLFGGTLDITSDPGKSTKILLEMPC